MVRILVFGSARKTDLPQSLQGMFKVDEMLGVGASVDLNSVWQGLVLWAL